VSLFLAIAAARAGVQAVWYALVTFPLFHYRSEMHCPWGDVNVMTAWNARLTFPVVLKYLPVALLLSAARLAGLWWTRRDLAGAQRLLLLIVFSAASALSIAYFPDFIKISFIAFVFLIAVAENLDWAVDRIPASWRLPRRLERGVAWLVAATLLVVSARHLYGNFVLLRSAFPVSHPTAFGRVDFASPDEARLRDALAALLDAAPSRDLYAYPILSDLYLTVPADNPTPYGFFIAFGYHRPEEVQRVIDILEARKPPYVVMVPPLLKPNDPIFRYVVGAYEPMSPTPLAGGVIYRRKSGV
jgi:hypothetical protein